MVEGEKRSSLPVSQSAELESYNRNKRSLAVFFASLRGLRIQKDKGRER